MASLTRLGSLHDDHAPACTRLGWEAYEPTRRMRQHTLPHESRACRGTVWGMPIGSTRGMMRPWTTCVKGRMMPAAWAHSLGACGLLSLWSVGREQLWDGAQTTACGCGLLPWSMRQASARQATRHQGDGSIAAGFRGLPLSW